MSFLVNLEVFEATCEPGPKLTSTMCDCHSVSQLYKSWLPLRTLEIEICDELGLFFITIFSCHAGKFHRQRRGGVGTRVVGGG